MVLQYPAAMQLSHRSTSIFLPSHRLFRRDRIRCHWTHRGDLHDRNVLILLFFALEVYILRPVCAAFSIVAALMKLFTKQIIP